jgi:Putative Actinobacterial Holin-X, holin superfamily III
VIRQAEHAEDLTARELAGQLGDQVARLVRSEVALARAELFAAARQAVLGGTMLTAAGVVGVGGWLALIAAAIAAIAAGLPVWAAALITGAALLAGGLPVGSWDSRDLDQGGFP